MAGKIRAFGAFAYDFVVGDDWRVAVGVVAALAATYWLSHAVKAASWWVVPAVLAVLIPLTLWRAVRKG
ncbi:MAG TPA: hypothetical protein VNF47_14680 [Streptosporangiaceae bacterium]|nr:hypothetical protein [Streptosporangiaceae bacterium]